MILSMDHEAGVRWIVAGPEAGSCPERSICELRNRTFNRKTNKNFDWKEGIWRMETKSRNVKGKL